MSSHIEMLRIAQDPIAVRSLARRLLAIPNQEWTDWEIDFLETMSRFEGPDLLTMRQREKLLELRDDAEYVTHYRGLSIKILNEKCHLARHDLEQEDADFIMSLQGQTAMQRRKLGRFLRCCRLLNELEPHM